MYSCDIALWKRGYGANTYIHAPQNDFCRLLDECLEFQIPSIVRPSVAHTVIGRRSRRG